MDQLLSWVAALPESSIYVALAVLAGLENIFPPIPADTVIVVGAFLAARGLLDWRLVFLSTWLGTAVVATAVYFVARAYGRPFFQGRLGRRLLSPRHIAAIERLYRRHGSLGILVTRVLPVWRAVVPPFAGLAHLNAWRTLPPLYIGSALWYGMLTFVVYRLGTTLEEAIRLIGGVNRGLGAAALLLAVLGAVVWWRSRRRRKRR